MGVVFLHLFPAIFRAIPCFAPSPQLRPTPTASGSVQMLPCGGDERASAGALRMGEGSPVTPQATRDGGSLAASAPHSGGAQLQGTRHLRNFRHTPALRKLRKLQQGAVPPPERRRRGKGAADPASGPGRGQVCPGCSACESGMAPLHGRPRGAPGGRSGRGRPPPGRIGGPARAGAPDAQA